METTGVIELHAMFDARAELISVGAAALAAAEARWISRAERSAKKLKRALAAG